MKKMSQTIVHEILISPNSIEKLKDLDYAEFENKDSDGRTLLMQAIIYNNLKAISYLIKHGAKLDAKDTKGWTPLHHAVQCENEKVIESLLKYGININIQDFYGNSPLWRAVFAYRGNDKIIELLLEHEADSNLENNFGISPKDLANTIVNYDVNKFFR